MADFCPPDLVANARRDFRAFDSGEQVADHDVTFRGNAYLVSVNPVYHDGVDSVIAISVALTDISRLKKLEVALSKSNNHLLTAYKQIKAFAETDALTGLLNRHGLETIFPKEIARARREQQPIAIALVDVDWFKSYNDSNGHIAGDAALKAVGTAIRSTIRRPGDWGARYGGEEFLIILPNTSIGGAQHVAMNVSRAVHDLEIVHNRSVFGQLTVSIGISGIETVPRDAATEEVYELLLHRADKALYAAKAAGRNTIKVSNSIE